MAVSDVALLLRTLLLSTSQINAYRHSTDKKRRRRIVGAAVGVGVLYALLVGYSVAVCVGYATIGIVDAAPAMSALVVCVLAFLLTLFKTNGYLFGFREYDLLMSLPFEARTVAASKFLYMYVKSLPWCLSISLATMVVYGWFAHPFPGVYPLWIVLTFFLPIVPMLAAALVGFLFARISAGLRHAALIQTVLTMAFVVSVFALRFVAENVFRNNETRLVLETLSGAIDQAARAYPPVGWFANAITGLDMLGALLLAGVSAVLFAAAFRVVGRSYGRINSALRSHAVAKARNVSAHERRSVVLSIVFKEFRRMTGSSVYMANGAMGMVLAVLLGLVTLVVGFDRIVAMATHDAPFDASILQPAIPLIVYLFVGMVATTAFTPSLEGKNYWIIQSLPIEKKVLYQGKMLFNMALTVPPALLSTLCLCVSARTPVLDALMYLLLCLVLCAFSTAWGCVCGIRHMRLDWENEIEVIKQGAAVTIYLLPNMFVCMALCAGVVFLGMRMEHWLLTLVLMLVVGVLAVLSYLRVMALSRRA